MKTFLILFVAFTPYYLFSQTITLDECIHLAINSSSKSKIQKSEERILNLKKSVNKYDFYPQIDLSFTPTSFSRSISPVTNTDGTDLYIQRSSYNSRASLRLSQKIIGTGGVVSINSSLGSYQDLQNGISNYNGNFFNINYNQPLNLFSTYKWKKKINIEELESDKFELLRRLEEQKLEVVNVFFDAIYSRRRNEIDSAHLVNITQHKKSILKLVESGKIPITEVLEIEIAIKETQISIQKGLNDFRQAIAKLSQLVSKELHSFELTLPYKPEYDINTLNEIIIRTDSIYYDYSYQVDLAKAERNVRLTKSKKGLNGSLSLGVGLNNSEDNLDDLLLDPSSRQNVNLTFILPLLNWGSARKEYEMAKLAKLIAEENQKVTSSIRNRKIEILYNNFQESIDEQEILELKKKLDNQKIKAITSKYLEGKIRFIDYQNAFLDRKRTLLDEVSILKKFWIFRFEMSKLILIDFITGKDLLMN